jgi:hypothetical protein
VEETVLRQAVRTVDPATADAAVALGVFGLEDNYVGITAGAVVAGAAADAVVPDGGPVVDGVAAVAGMHVAREVNAQRQGVTVQMLVTVTPDRVVLFDYQGGTVTRTVHAFDRATMTVEVKRFGLSRRVHLQDGEFEIGLTGSTAFYSSASAGDKHVLAELLSAGGPPRSGDV